MKYLFFSVILVCFMFTSSAKGDSLGDLEEVLKEKRWDELDAVTTEYLRIRNLTERIIISHERGVINNIATFLKQYDICYGMLPSKDLSSLKYEYKNEIKLCYQNLVDNLWKEIHSAGIPYKFSQSLKDEINNKGKLAKNKLKDINTEVRLIERQWEEEVKRLISGAHGKAVDSPVYIIQDSSCNICNYLEEKRHSEKEIENEKRYSKQYGVTNLSKIDMHKQRIMKIDWQLSHYKKEYKKIVVRHLTPLSAGIKN